MTKEDTYRITVYEKNDLPTQRIFSILSIICLVLIGISFLFDLGQSVLSGFISYTCFALMIIIGVISIIHSIRYNGPYGETSYLTVNNGTINFFHRNLHVSKVDKVVIRLRYKEVQYSRIMNNYMEIEAQGEVYKFGVLIRDNTDVSQIKGIVDSLKPKVKKIIYENYL